MEISIIALPLIASIISGFFGKFIGDRNSEIVTSSLVAISAILSLASSSSDSLSVHALELLSVATPLMPMSNTTQRVKIQLTELCRGNSNGVSVEEMKSIAAKDSKIVVTVKKVSIFPSFFSFFPLHFCTSILGTLK